MLTPLSSRPTSTKRSKNHNKATKRQKIMGAIIKAENKKMMISRSVQLIWSVLSKYLKKRSTGYWINPNRRSCILLRRLTAISQDVDRDWGICINWMRIIWKRLISIIKLLRNRRKSRVMKKTGVWPKSTIWLAIPTYTKTNKIAKTSPSNNSSKQ